MTPSKEEMVVHFNSIIAHIEFAEHSYHMLAVHPESPPDDQAMFERLRENAKKYRNMMMLVASTDFDKLYENVGKVLGWQENSEQN